MDRSRQTREPATDPRARTRRALCEHADEVRRRELAEALGRLDGELTDDQRAVVRRLTGRLTGRLVAPALSALADGEAGPGTVADLFELPEDACTDHGGAADAVELPRHGDPDRDDWAAATDRE